MPTDYLNLSAARDLASLGDRIIYRVFEVLPGFLSWLTLLMAVLFSWLAPFAVAIFIIAFDFYWLLRVLYLALHQVASYRKMKANIRTDWLGKLEADDQKAWRDMYHLVILPFAKEEKSVVAGTLQSIKAASYPKDRMIVVLALEERAGSGAKRVAAELEKEFGNDFLSLSGTVHPDNIPGELAGKGANVDWCVKKIKERLLPQLGIPEEKIIVSLFDIDTKPYPQYFFCLTWNFLAVPDALRKSFQPIPVYNNNIWDSPAVSRIIATSATFFQMMQQERSEQLVTFSSHSMSLKTLVEVGYPYNNVSDDSRIFWRAYFKYRGKYQVVPMYYPVSMDAVLSSTLTRTMVNQYKQQRRWSWGVENVPYVFFNLLKNPASAAVSIREKFFHAVNMIEGFWSWATCSILTFCLGWLPLMLGGRTFNGMLLSYNLPRVTSIIMTMAMIGMIVSAIISMLLLPPRPANYGKLRSFSMVVQWAFLPVALIIFGSVPALESQTRLMINKPLGFWVTEKGRKKD